MERIICLLIGYVFGLFQTSYIYGKLHGIDIRNYGSGNAGTTNMLRTLTAAGVIPRHNFPFYLNFRGGKGIAATAGLILSLGPVMTVISLVIFGGTLALTHYVSLGSLLVYTGFMIQLIAFGQHGSFGMTQPYLNEMYAVGLVLMLLAFWMHRENIRRLLHGEERKTYLFKKKK